MLLGGLIHVARIHVKWNQGPLGPKMAPSAVDAYNRLVETATPPPEGLFIEAVYEHDIVPFERAFLALRPGTPIYKRFKHGLQ